jgi:hypothetical protein
MVLQKASWAAAVGLALSVAATGCADADNPTALADLNPETQFEIGTARIETFEEVEIHIDVMESGSPMTMRQAELEIEHETGGPPRVIEMEAHDDGGYMARVTFFEPGEYHLHFRGRPAGHNLMGEMGDHEIEVHRRHQVIGPYWVELELDPAPVLEFETAHIHVLVFEILGDETLGDPVEGLDLELEIHDLGGVETPLVVTEEGAGEYEAEYRFGESGLYELHVEIDGDDGEFHIPVLTSIDDSDVDDGDGHGDNGGGHGH